MDNAMKSSAAGLGRTAIVTGTASGLGRAIAVRLARDGWHLALADVNGEGNRETLALVESAGGTGRIEQLDVADAEGWQSMIARLRADWPRLDLLVNNAGVASSGHVGEHTLEDWHWMVEINLFGVIHGCHFALPWLKANPNGGHIVNVASVAAVMCAPSMAAYNVTKAGVVALSETLHGELLTSSVRVTVVCPGFVETNLLEKARYRSQAMREYSARAMKSSPLSAARLANDVVRAMRKKRLYVFLPAMARRQWWFKRLVPQFYLNRIARSSHALFS
jgi:NAD(P)-dependent dehydrogenase (short-subunit alcohol dehydrogenase family)